MWNPASTPGLALAIDAAFRSAETALIHHAKNCELIGPDHLVVSISNGRWEGRAIILTYAVSHTETLITLANKRFKQHFHASALGVISVYAIRWSKRTHRQRAKVAVELHDRPDLLVGGALSLDPGLLPELKRISASGSVPCLIIALDTARTKESRLSCKFRARAYDLDPKSEIVGNA